MHTMAANTNTTRKLITLASTTVFKQQKLDGVMIKRADFIFFTA